MTSNPIAPFKRRLAAVAISTLLATPFAFAVNGAQPGGYGIENAAMGGASIALPLDSVAAANNPAGMAYVPDTLDLNLQVFHGQSSSNYVLPGNELSNDTKTLVPEAGVNWRVGNDMTFGISLNAAGSGADYKRPALPLPGADNAKSSLRVVEFIPTLSWKPQPNLALGAGLNLAYEQFQASGVIVPAPVPGGMAQLPDYGTQSAHGVGLRLGVLWQITPETWVGANYKTRTHMSELDGYKNDLLSYENGRIDIPSQYGVGISWRPASNWTLAADWLQIQWGGIKLMQDPAGFQWKDQSILRGGVAWRANDSWTLRAGYSRNREQVSDDHVAQNLLVPSILNRAYTLGASFQIDSKSKVSVGYEYNPSTTLIGSGASTGTTLASKVEFFMLGYQRTF